MELPADSVNALPGSPDQNLRVSQFQAEGLVAALWPKCFATKISPQDLRLIWNSY
jgi:hypothetical protein